MFGDVVQEVMAHVEVVVSAKMGELEERLSKLLSGCAKEASVREESDALKVLLAGNETRFREEYAALAKAINAHQDMTKEQMIQLDALCREVKTINEKLSALCSHTGRLGNIERDVAAISKSIQGVSNKTDTVSSFVTHLNKHLDDIRLVVEHKANEIRKAEEKKRVAELKVQEEKRKAEEAARQKEERERKEKREMEEAMRASFSGKNLEVMAKGVTALKEWTGKARATIVYDSTKDAFTHNGLFEKVKAKKNIALVGFTTDGDVFGGFYSCAVTQEDDWFYDPNIFAFSFESRGRCTTPQRFAVNEGPKQKAGVCFYSKNYSGFVVFWAGSTSGLSLGNESSNSYCWSMSRGFHGLVDTTLTGKNGHYDKGPFHHCARLVAVHLE